MGKNLIICCDGTNNEFGLENTNVVRLSQILHRDPIRQRLYYDPGVGTLPEPGAFGWARKKYSQIMGLAFGAGLTWKVGEAYSYLMNLWEPGDRVYLFGFSRGAYSVRVLAGLLHTLGLLPRGNDNLVPYVLRLFKSIRGHSSAGSGGSSRYWQICDEFRWSFARPLYEADDERRFRVHFLGVWDTVSSVGWVWDPATFPYTARNPGIDVIRHAVSIDERRWFFRQNLMSPNEGQDFGEEWFPGVHCDVGGGYPESEGGLWRCAFEWMVAEAEKSGLEVDRARLEKVLTRTVPPTAPWTERQHESLTGAWWPAEFFPKLRRLSRDSPLRVPKLGLGHHRSIPPRSSINKAALLRIREQKDYAPANFPAKFLEKMRGLAELPDQLPFEPD